MASFGQPTSLSEATQQHNNTLRRCHLLKTHLSCCDHHQAIILLPITMEQFQETVKKQRQRKGAETEGGTINGIFWAGFWLPGRQSLGALGAGGPVIALSLQ